MKIVTNEDIQSLNIKPEQCVEWVREALLIKDQCQLPPKVSLHPQGNDFINTMPCILPPDYHTYGCKIVSRINGQHPALNSTLMVMDTHTGKMTAAMDADWITASRTGAVAALAIQTFKSSGANIYSFIGLGAMGYATLECLLALLKGQDIIIRLKRYKDHAEKCIEHFREYSNVMWEIAETAEDLVMDADVVVSCITEAKDLLVKDTDLFKPGCLVVPVHTRGFQNCDLVFDKVFADDRGHVKDFRYFNHFKQFGEFSDVLQGKITGRDTDQQRILSYNIGLGLHDIFFGHQILSLLTHKKV